MLQALPVGLSGTKALCNRSFKDVRNPGGDTGLADCGSSTGMVLVDEVFARQVALPRRRLDRDGAEAGQLLPIQLLRRELVRPAEGLRTVFVDLV